MILLIPGPVNLSERVRHAMLRPDICHREIEFTDLQTNIRSGLLRVYDLDPARWSAVLLTGTGTAAVEAMISSLIPPHGKLLVLENGVYGERMTLIAQAHGIPVTTARHEWTDPIDLRTLEAILTRESGITHVAAVHHETTTGRLNDLSAIGAICRQHNVQLLVDAVSSFGAEAIAFHDWGITACAATANKCLHGVPGASFVIVRRDRLPPASQPSRSVYLDLANYGRQQDRGTTPFTASIQVFYTLDQALRELADCGDQPARHAQYKLLAQRVLEGLKRTGIQPLLAEDESSVVLRSYHLPVGFGYREFHDALKHRGFIIYAGQGKQAKHIFRVSTMGQLNLDDMDRFVETVGNIVE